MSFLRIISVLFAVLLCPLCRAQVGVTTFGIAPEDTVHLSRPLLVWHVVPSVGKVKAVQMTLNDKPVTARYDTDKRCAIGTLDAPLAPGAYDVRCELIVDNGRSYPRLWSFTVDANPLEKAPDPVPAAASALETINQIRRKAGLPPYTLDARLCAAAMEYSRAVAEQAGKTASPVPDLSMVIKQYCYPGQCVEVVGEGFQPAQTIVPNFCDGPYHRSLFLVPQSCDIGFGTHNDKSGGSVVTLLVSMPDETATIVYPRDGQKDVPLDWTPQDDSDNPLKVHGVAAGEARFGFPITLSAVGPYGGKLSEVKAALVTEAGVPVPFYLNTPANDKDHLESGVILIPRQPLQPGTTYKVTVTGQDEHEEEVTVTWVFTTAVKKPEPPAAKSGPKIPTPPAPHGQKRNSLVYNAEGSRE